LFGFFAKRRKTAPDATERNLLISGKNVFRPYE
jgi:hypothetical protein